ncbi:heavy-metal-associated domain-containing protein [Eggerthella sinensis]|uniref:heavy-metal-associated domain-containing protein n=1 Tax=Eggerthella sinensis TaxID=242230 RepID=UPI00248F43E0|nr:heavy metal-associated domain-containing protein [Eggerthella sinensis]
MNAPTFVILAIILVLCVFSARRMYRSFTGKGDCCGGGGGAPKVKRAKVSDTDEAHYPYRAEVKVGGMTCARCASTVENALNGVEGTWARVDLDAGTARILSKSPIDDDAIADAVTAAGYYLDVAR